MFTSETAQQLRPFVQRWIQEAVEGAAAAGGGGAPSPHALNSSHHTGTLADSQAPQFAKTDGSRPFTGNIQIASGKMIDGVDLSAFKGLYDAHLSADSHGNYAHAEGFGTRRAYGANRLFKSINNGAGILGGGPLTSDVNIAVDFANAAPGAVGLSGAVGIVNQAAREDHTHALDVSISPTWTGTHTFSQRTVHNGGIHIDTPDTLEFGSDVVLQRGGADRLQTPDEFQALRLGANVDPSYALHIKAQAADTKIISALDESSVEQFQIDYLGVMHSRGDWNSTRSAELTPTPGTNVVGWLWKTGWTRQLSPSNQSNFEVFRIEDAAGNPFFTIGRMNRMILYGEAQGDTTLVPVIDIRSGKNTSGGGYSYPGLRLETSSGYTDIGVGSVRIDAGGELLRLDSGGTKVFAFRTDTSWLEMNGRYGFNPVEFIANTGLTLRGTTGYPNPLLSIKRTSGQTAVMTDWRNESDGVQAVIDKDFLWAIGKSSTTASVRLDVRYDTEQLRLSYSDSVYGSFKVNSIGTLTLESIGNTVLKAGGDVVLDPTGNDVVPNLSYDINLGTPTKKWLTLHAAELWVETLVAQETAVDIDGRVLVGSGGNSLTRDLDNSSTTIYLKYNTARAGDTLRFEARMRVEFMLVTAGPTLEGAGDYSYTVTRSVDPTGPNPWIAGDACFNTGIAGNGWIDLHALHGVSGIAPDYIFNMTSGGSFSSNLRDERDFTIFGNATTGAMLYLGMAGSGWRNIYFYIVTAASGTGSVIWEYWNGSTWFTFTPSFTGSFVGTGLYAVEWANLIGWSAQTINGTSAYWVRARLSGASGYSRPVQGNRRVITNERTFGPTMAFNVRQSSTFNDWLEYAVMGNLNGYYGVGTDTFGFAAGKYGGSYLTAEEVNGLRLFSNGVVMGHWKLTGDLILGPEGAQHVKATSSVVQFKDGAGNIYTELGSGYLRIAPTTGNYLYLDGTSIDFRTSGGVSQANLSGTDWRLGQSTGRHILMSPTEFSLKQGTSTYMRGSGSTLWIGNESNEHVEVNSSGTQVNDGATTYASFAATTTIGRTDLPYLRLASSAIEFRDSSNNSHVFFSDSVFRMGRQGSGFTWLEFGSTYLKFRSQSGVTVVEPLKFDATGLGYLEAGLEIGSAGYLKSGRTYASGSGFWVGLDSGSHKLVVGNSSGAQLQWSGSALTLRSASGNARTEFTGNGIRGYNSLNVLQAEMSGSDGKFRAAAGAVILDADGISIDVDVSNGTWFKVKKAAAELFTLESFENTSGTVETRTTLYSKRTSAGSYIQFYVDKNSLVSHYAKLDGPGEQFITSAKGNFSAASIQIKVVTTAPVTAGAEGDMVLYQSGGVYRLYAYLNAGWRII